MYSQPKNQNPDTSTHEYVNRSQTSNTPTIDFSEIERTQRPDVSKSNLTNTLPTNKTSTLHSFPNIEYTNNRFFRNQKFEYEHARLYNLSDQIVRILFKQKQNGTGNQLFRTAFKQHQQRGHIIFNFPKCKTSNLGDK